MMKNLNFKKLLPHLIAVGIFLIITVIFCKPALESGVVLKQSDISGWEGMSKQSFEHKEATGKFPLWITSMFSGMPAYQVAMEGAWSPLGYIDQAFQLWLPQPLNFFFLACICFYFLCICLRVRPYAAIIGALAFAYCSFSPIIITAGHNTQMLGLAYAPAVIGGVILIFNKKYLSGFALTSLFTALQIGQGHQQISYYLFIVLIFMTVAWIINMIREKQNIHIGKSLGLLLIAGIIGVGVNALTLFTVYDFAKDSKRGGQLVMEPDANAKTDGGKTKGLSKEYAFQWSYGKGETFSLMFPGVKGYGLHYAERDGENYLFPKVDESSEVVKYMTETLNVPPDGVEQLSAYMSQRLYWGDQPFTNGPVYLGAVICFLFILGMFLLDNKHKWWILAVSVFAVLLAWGSNLAGFNYFIFDYMPLYNKFRVPTMTLVIPQLVFPIMAVLVLNKLIDNSIVDSWKKFRQGLMATAAVFIFALGYYASNDFSLENRQRTAKFNQVYDPQDQNMNYMVELSKPEFAPKKDNQLYEEMIQNFRGDPNAQKNTREIVSALQKDRAGLFMGDIIRSLIFVLLAAALIGLYLKKKVGAMLMLAGVTILSVFDLLGFGMKYLNDKSFASKDLYESNEFPLSSADEQIRNDKDPNFRVFNLAGGDPFQESRTSYYHKSIGGYHPAKLGIYDDLIAHQLGGSPNIGVINMLNTKYVIQRQGDQLVAAPNPGALGNAWFVDNVHFVNGPVAEMNALTGFSPKDSAIVDASFRDIVKGYTPADSSASIRMTAFDNDAITYESNASGTHVAIFSEIFYKDWNAYIDGKKTEIFKANYVLRGLVIPAGKHKIEFKFEPSVYYTSRTLSNVFTWILMIMLIAALFLEFRKNNAANKIG